MPDDASCHVHRNCVLYNESSAFLIGEVQHTLVVDGLRHVIIRFGVYVPSDHAEISPPYQTIITQA